MKLRALDLFCGAGGATKGLQLAGFHVTGVDQAAQPRYCGDAFIRADALTVPLAGYDFIWASPPCQAYCALRHLHPDRRYPDLIAAVRERLIASGVRWTIENVPGAPLLKPTMLCGSAFGLRVRRHRLFESNWFWFNDKVCLHGRQGRPIDVSGTGGRRINRRPNDHGGNTNKPRNLAEARQAIGIDWAVRAELAQAIPPAFSLYIAQRFFEAQQ